MKKSKGDRWRHREQPEQTSGGGRSKPSKDEKGGVGGSSYTIKQTRGIERKAPSSGCGY